MKSQKTDKIIAKSVVGAKLEKRFQIGKIIDQGSFGQLYKVLDRNDKTRALAIKISAHGESLQIEVESLRQI